MDSHEMENVCNRWIDDIIIHGICVFSLLLNHITKIFIFEWNNVQCDVNVYVNLIAFEKGTSCNIPNWSFQLLTIKRMQKSVKLM